MTAAERKEEEGAGGCRGAKMEIRVLSNEKEEGNIGFSQGSVLSNTGHPQRSAISEAKAGKRKENQGKKESPDKAEKNKEEVKNKDDNKEEKAAKTEKKDHAGKENKQKKKEEGK